MNNTELLENQELIQKLINAGFGNLVECLLETTSYTKKSRSNKSAICRQLSIKNKQLEDMLKKCREILKKDMTLD